MQSEFQVKELLSNTTCNKDDLICVGDADNANANRHMKVSDFILRVKNVVVDATSARICTASDSGCIIACSTGMTATLPMASTVGLGGNITFVQTSNLAMVINSYTADGNDIMICGASAGVATSDKVSFTAGSSVGVGVEFIAVSPTKWWAKNLGSGAIVVEAAD